MRSLFVLTCFVSAMLQQPGAKVMFYDPADVAAVAVPASPSAAKLRPIAFVESFPAHGHVGIHYWFETESGVRVTESGASALGGYFTLHIRNNVGGGFLTVWLMSGQDGRQLTPMEGQYTGYHMSHSEYVVPEGIQLSPGDSEKHVLVVYGRSQTEQVRNGAGARQKLALISSWTGPHGPKLIRETDDATPGQIGTYIVNQDGGPLAVEIVLRPR